MSAPDDEQLWKEIARFVRKVYSRNRRPTVSNLCEMVREQAVVEILWRGRKPGRPLLEYRRTFANEVDQFPGRTRRDQLRGWGRANDLKDVDRSMEMLEQIDRRSRIHLKKP